MGNVNMEAYQVHYEGNKSVAEKLKEFDGIGQQIEDLSDIVSIKADRLDIAPNFSEENAYSAGDLVYHSGRLWQFSDDHAAGPWDSSEVTAANIDIALSELKNTLTETAYGQLNTNKAKLLLYKKAGIAFLRIENLSSINAGNNLIEGIIPVGYRPSVGFKTCLVERSSTYQRLVELTVLKNGDVEVYNYGSDITQIAPFSGTLSYPIA